MHTANENGHLDCVAVSMSTERACFRRVALVACSGRTSQGSRIYSRVIKVQSTGRAIYDAVCAWHACSMPFPFPASPYSNTSKHSMPLGNPCISSMDGRTKIRDRYHIDGNRFTDCLSHTFCLPCALTQESREIALEEGNLTVPRLEMGSIRRVFHFLWSSCVHGFSWVCEVVDFVWSLCVSGFSWVVDFLSSCVSDCFDFCESFLVCCGVLCFTCFFGVPAIY